MSWPSVKLDSIANVFNGKTPSRDQQRDSGFPVLKIKDVTDSRKFRGEFKSFVELEVAEKSRDKYLCENDTLILNAAHNADYVGSKQYCVEPSAVGSLPTGEWLVVRTIDENSLDSRYLNFWLWSPSCRHQIRQFVKGIHLYPKDVARLEIPLPPLPVQKHIAAVLEKADTLRQQCQQMETELNALAQSVFLDMFGDPVKNPKGWKQSSLSLSADLVIDCPHSTPKWTKEGVVCIRTSNLTKGGWDFTDKRFVDSEQYKGRTARSEIESGDIILSREGTIGVAAKVEDGMNICMGQRLVQVRPNYEYLLSDFLLFQLLYLLEPHRLSSVMSGSTVKHLNMRDIRSLKIVVPPIYQQYLFSECIENINKLKEERASLNLNIEEEFNSLMQRAFKGELNLSNAA